MLFWLTDVISGGLLFCFGSRVNGFMVCLLNVAVNDLSSCFNSVVKGLFFYFSTLVAHCQG